MRYNSIWLDNLKEDNNVSSLDKDIYCDVLIIGGGLTGLSCAYNLIDSNKTVVIAEANRVGMGITSKTTGKITYLQENIYTKLNDNISYDISKQYYESQKDAIDIIVNIINKNNIKCDLEKVTSFVFSNKDSEINKLKREKQILEDFGCEVFEKEIPIDISSKYQISIEDSYVFHPIKYIRELKKIVCNSEIKIYEDSKIEDIIKKDLFYCKCNKHIIKAKTIVLACHYPFFFNSCLLPLKSHIEKSFIIAVSNKENKKVSMINISKPIKSIRFYKDNLIFLSSSDILCNSIDYENIKDNIIKKINNKSNIINYWSNHDIIINDSLPLIGKLTKDIYIGTGYNTWGMTNASLAGKIISDLIMNNDNKYAKLFNPNRKFNKLKLYSFPVNMYANVKGFIVPLFNKNLVNYKDVNGEKVAYYNGYTVKTKCPHMKCSLIFNAVEKTWDCPCHGSRFKYDGTYLIGPSKDDIIFKI